jgi:polar amino acid transport system substrate-binding protein
MHLIALSGILLAMSVGIAAAADPTAMTELAPTGKLRLGVAYAPVATALFVVKDASGMPHGVTVDLGTALAQALGVPVDVFAAPNTGELTDALESGRIDAAFMPMDDERRKRIAFGPAYFAVESTYLVPAGSSINAVADADRPDVTIVGVANTTTIRSAGRTAKTAKVVAATSIDDAMAMMKSGAAHAFAMGRDALPPLQEQLPGSRILDDAFQATGVAVAVPKGRPAALAFVTEFLERAKADGTVRRSFDAAGLKAAEVAPPEPQR